jgi:hypothetical protein
MRLVLRCMINEVPVEILIEGAGLNPIKLGKILGSCLEEIDACLEKVTLKDNGALGKEREAGEGCHNSPYSSSPGAGSPFPHEDPLGQVCRSEAAQTQRRRDPR